MLILILEAFATTLQFETAAPVWSLVKLYLPYLSMVACAMLIVAVFQQDPSESVEHDWLTRPIAKLDLLFAKFAFLCLTILAPMMLAHLVANLMNGRSLLESILQSTVFESSWTMLVIPFLMAIAILSRSFMQALGTLLVSLVVLVIFASLASIVKASPEAINDDLYSYGLSWMQAIVVLASNVAGLWLGFRYQFQQRDPGRARNAVAATTLVSIMAVTVPFFAPVWPAIFPILQSTVNEPDLVAADALQLDSLHACYPASVIGTNESEHAKNASTEGAKTIIGAPYWEERHLKAAGPHSVTYATTVTTRNLPLDWRVLPLKAMVTYTSAGLPERLQHRPAHVPSTANVRRGGITNFWLASEELQASTPNDSTTKVEFDYRLALLAPTSFTLPIDNVRRHFPKVGYCSAKRDRAKNKVIVDCFKRGIQPTLVSAEFVDVPASRVDGGPPSFSPRWLDVFDGQRYEMIIDAPTLKTDPQVLVTAFESKAFVNKSRTSSELFGTQGSTCPPPDAPKDMQSQWSDGSTHKGSLVAVDQGVNLEVLNWGGPNTGTGNEPKTLVLLAGAGGTAHFYDDLAPILATKYRVIGITRRGFGGSSKPDFGYDIARLSEDIAQVLDTLKIKSPILVGHSFAGDELTYLGSRYPDRFAALIYLDAAYDRSRKNTEERSLLVSLPPTPLPALSELASRTAIQPYLDRIGSVGLPEGEMMMSMDLSVGRRKYDERHAQAMMSGVVAPAYDKIKVPALSMYAVPTSADKLMEPWYGKNDARIREAVDARFKIRSEYQQKQIAKFKAEVANAEVVVLKDADHSIFISNQDDVVREMERFVGKLE